MQRRNPVWRSSFARFTEVVKMPEPRLHPSDVGELVDNAMVLYRQACRDKQIVLEWGTTTADRASFTRSIFFEQAGHH